MEIGRGVGVGGDGPWTHRSVSGSTGAGQVSGEEGQGGGGGGNGGYIATRTSLCFPIVPYHKLTWYFNNKKQKAKSHLSVGRALHTQNFSSPKSLSSLIPTSFLAG